MTIRLYKADDHQACLGIFDSNTPPFFDFAERNFLENWLNKKDQNEMCYPNNKVESFFVVEFKEKVIACGGYYIPTHQQCANMVWGMVHKDSHRKGLGKALILFRINEITSQHPNHNITLDTSQHTFRFFEQLGFKTVKRIENAYGEGLHRYDMILENN